MEAKDGSFGFDFAGVYSEVTPERSMTYRLDDDREVTTTFEDKDGGTLVTTTFDAETQNDPEMQRGGWQAILNNFKTHAEK